jgi:hypothetical protein
MWVCEGVISYVFNWLPKALELPYLSLAMLQQFTCDQLILQPLYLHHHQVAACHQLYLWHLGGIMVLL